jgi:transposase-like protein
MPTGFIYKCNNCGYAVTLSGIWEFYIDEFGLRQKYGHLSRSAEAQKAGVMGFSVEWYCPTCRSVRDVVVIEFNDSQKGPLPALMAYYDRPETEHAEFEPICDKCNSKLTDEIEGEICPKCNVGHFVEYGRFMS